jgi:hypothetical protein
MDIHAAFQVASQTDLSRPRCPRCGCMMFAAERSAFNVNGRIWHAWCCDDCGNEFVTTISVLPPQA